MSVYMKSKGYILSATVYTKSIISTVKYEVTKYTGAQVRAVNIYIDSMVID